MKGAPPSAAQRAFRKPCAGREAQGALDVTLTAADLARIAQAVPADAVVGTRYLPTVLAHIDSEKMET
jgi:hypothetical protein